MAQAHKCCLPLALGRETRPAVFPCGTELMSDDQQFAGGQRFAKEHMQCYKDRGRFRGKTIPSNPVQSERVLNLNPDMVVLISPQTKDQTATCIFITLTSLIVMTV